MYLKEVHVRNIRSLERLAWKPDHQGPGWHVLLGDNGSGKTTLLRAIVFALLGPIDAGRAELKWQRWLRLGAKQGSISVSIEADSRWDRLGRTRPGDHSDEIVASLGLTHLRHGAQLAKGDSETNAQRSVWSEEIDRGWFAASFGSLRRFSGSDRSIAELYEGSPRIARHTTLLFENVSLESTYRWLQRTVDPRNAESDAAAGRILRFLSQENLLHDGVRFRGLNLEDELYFSDQEGREASIVLLSDGYKSYFGLVASLLRSLVETYGADALFDEKGTTVLVPGVVLIDEIDVHLHPHWQRHVGMTLTRLMPNVQWIVSSHSPFICQAAEKGSICRLRPSAKAGQGEMVRGEEFKELVFGTAGNAFTTSAFGAVPTRSKAGVEYLGELAELNNTELGRKLELGEKQRQAELRALLPQDAYALEAAVDD